MRKAMAFVIDLLLKAGADNIVSMANEMTYKGLMAVFPLIIFTMSLLGFLNIDSDLLLNTISPYLPDQVMSVFIVFIDEVIDTKNKTLLSTSLLVVIYSSASGFKAIMRGINKSFGVADKRGFIRNTLISILLVFIFAATVILSLAVLIFGDVIKTYLSGLIDADGLSWSFYNFILYVIVTFIILFSIMIIYKVSLNCKATFNSLFPGAAVTLILWLVSSKIFNVYVNSFSRYSMIYGSIGSIFILVIWINIIALIMLIGSEINAILESCGTHNK